MLRGAEVLDPRGALSPLTRLTLLSRFAAGLCFRCPGTFSLCRASFSLLEYFLRSPWDQPPPSDSTGAFLPLSADGKLPMEKAFGS